MKSFVIDLDALLTVVAAIVDADGVLLKANAGFLRLFPPGCAVPLGTQVTGFFIQPSFAELLAALDRDADEGYRGLMTLGEFTSKTRTLRGRVWKSAVGIQILAEYDIADLEKLNDAMLELNQDSSVAQHALARANVALKQREVRSNEASLTDALTGVGNRRKLEQSLALEILKCHNSGGKLSAIMTDVDFFKRVNDEYGHGGGDKVLVSLGALLKSQTRLIDTVARFGGEEFVVLMPDANLAQAASKAEQLRSALSAEPIAPLTKCVTSSFGVAELASGEDAESFLRRVDLALYEAKAGGRNRVVSAGSPPPA